MKKIKVLSVIGTRPDAIKMAPLIRLLNCTPEVEHITCSSGQHGKVLTGILDFFEISTDYDLKVLKPGQSLAELTAAMLLGFRDVLQDVNPHWILVHGDTATCLAATLAGFYLKLNVGHVEAGLRSHQLTAPFPEEAQRCLTDKLSSVHFAPTRTHARNLLSEGFSSKSIVVTGNTIVDALQWTLQHVTEFSEDIPGLLREVNPDKELILVTCHRRENLPVGLENVCKAVRRVALNQLNRLIAFPLHPNPEIRLTAEQILGRLPNVLLLPPLNYPDFVLLLQRATLILTDSGGIQEEATVLGKPVLVTRNSSERESVSSEFLVGTDPNRIESRVNELLVSRPAVTPSHLYGDGKASERILQALLRFSERMTSFSYTHDEKTASVRLLD